MSRHKKSSRHRGGENPSRPRQPYGRGASDKPRRRLWPLVIGLGFGAVVLIAAVLLRPMIAGRGSVASPGAVQSDLVASAMSILPPPGPGTKSPINDVDPVTNKPITPASPTINYKGYVIGFCCASSAGYTGGWAAMSDSQKDAFVRKYLK